MESPKGILASTEGCLEPEGGLNALYGLALLDPDLMRFALSHRPFQLQQILAASHSLSFDHRRRPDTLRAAIATAFFCPTNTTRRLPRVTPV